MSSSVIVSSVRVHPIVVEYLRVPLPSSIGPGDVVVIASPEVLIRCVVEGDLRVRVTRRERW